MINPSQLNKLHFCLGEQQWNANRASLMHFFCMNYVLRTLARMSLFERSLGGKRGSCDHFTAALQPACFLLSSVLEVGQQRGSPTVPARWPQLGDIATSLCPAVTTSYSSSSSTLKPWIATGRRDESKMIEIRFFPPRGRKWGKDRDPSVGKNNRKKEEEKEKKNTENKKKMAFKEWTLWSLADTYFYNWNLHLPCVPKRHVISSLGGKEVEGIFSELQREVLHFHSCSA